MADELRHPQKESIRRDSLPEETIHNFCISMSRKLKDWPCLGPKLRHGERITLRLNPNRAENKLRLQANHGR